MKTKTHTKSTKAKKSVSAKKSVKAKKDRASPQSQAKPAKAGKPAKATKPAKAAKAAKPAKAAAVFGIHPHFAQLTKALPPGRHADGLLLVTKPGVLDAEMAGWLMGQTAGRRSNRTYRLR